MNRADVTDSVAVGLWIVAIGALAIFAIIHLLSLMESLRLSMTRPFSMSFTGGLLSYYAANPLDLYQPADPVPHPTIYGPLFPLLVPVLPGVPTIVTARAVSWLAIAASTAMVGYHAWRYSGRYGVAVVVAGLFVLAPTFHSPTVILRVDHLALALTLAAITAYTRRWPLGSVILLSVAAAFVKQPYAIVAIAPITLAYWFGGRRREAALYFGLSAFLGLFVLANLAFMTNGWAFTHLVAYNAVIPWYTDVFLSQTYSFLVKHGITVAIGIGMLATIDRDDWADPVPWLFVVGLLVAFATVGKEGSWIGYFYPALTAATILVARALPTVEVTSAMPTERQVTVIVVLFLVVTQLAAFTFIQTTPQKAVGGQERVHDYLEGREGAVLSEDPSIVPDPENPVDMFMVMGLVESGYVGGDPLADALACGRWRYVVTWVTADHQQHEYRRWTEAQQRAIETHYERVSVESGYSVYRYKEGERCQQPG